MRKSISRVALALGVAAMFSLPGLNGHALPVARAGDITLQLWYHAYGEVGTHDAVLRYAKQYEASHPGVHVNVTWVVGQGAYDPKLAAALLTNNGPDVFEHNVVTVADIRAGHVLALDDLYTPSVRADFNPRALSEVTYGGHVYAVKMITDTGGVYYRKSLFAKAGIKSPPSTFADLLADAKKLTTGGVKGLFIGNDNGVSALSTVLLWSAGVDVMAGSKIAFDNPRTVAAYQALRTLNQSGVLLSGSPTDWWDPSAFTQGLAAMQWCGLWAMPGIRKAIGNDFGYVPWPALDAKGQAATFWGGWAEYVNPKSHNLAAAKDLVRWMWIQNTALQADWNTGYGFHVPPRHSAIAAASKLETGQAQDAVVALQKYSHFTPPLFDSAAGTALQDAATAAAKSSSSIADAVHAAAVKAQAEVNNELK